MRLLQTVGDVASDKNSTLVMPFPVELLRFFEQAAGGRGNPEVASSGDRASLPAGGQMNGNPANRGRRDDAETVTTGSAEGRG